MAIQRVPDPSPDVLTMFCLWTRCFRGVESEADDLRNSPSLKSKSSASHDLVLTCGRFFYALELAVLAQTTPCFRRSYEVVIIVDYDRQISSDKIPRWTFSYALVLATRELVDPDNIRFRQLYEAVIIVDYDRQFIRQDIQDGVFFRREFIGIDNGQLRSLWSLSNTTDAHHHLETQLEASVSIQYQ